VNAREVPPDGGVVDRRDVVAGEREEVLDTVGGERVDETVGSGP
jgi:hypothetical protein